MEHASTGAGADYNPVKRGMTNVLSCPWIQSQHFWDGLRKKKKTSHRCKPSTLSRPHLLLIMIIGNRTTQPGVAWQWHLYRTYSTQNPYLACDQLSVCCQKKNCTVNFLSLMPCSTSSCLQDALTRAKLAACRKPLWCRRMQMRSAALLEGVHTSTRLLGTKW